MIGLVLRCPACWNSPACSSVSVGLTLSVVLPESVGLIVRSEAGEARIQIRSGASRSSIISIGIGIETRLILILKGVSVVSTKNSLTLVRGGLGILISKWIQIVSISRVF